MRHEALLRYARKCVQTAVEAEFASKPDRQQRNILEAADKWLAKSAPHLKPEFLAGSAAFKQNEAGLSPFRFWIRKAIQVAAVETREAQAKIDRRRARLVRGIAHA